MDNLNGYLAENDEIALVFGRCELFALEVYGVDVADHCVVC